MYTRPGTKTTRSVVRVTVRPRVWSAIRSTLTENSASSVSRVNTSCTDGESSSNLRQPPQSSSPVCSTDFVSLKPGILGAGISIFFVCLFGQQRTGGTRKFQSIFFILNFMKCMFVSRGWSTSFARYSSGGVLI